MMKKMITGQIDGIFQFEGAEHLTIANRLQNQRSRVRPRGSYRDICTTILCTSQGLAVGDTLIFLKLNRILSRTSSV